MARPTRKFPTARIIAMRSRPCIQWTWERKIYRISLGDIDDQTATRRLAEINGALTGADWPTWTDAAEAVQRYRAETERPAAPAPDETNEILQDYFAHITSNRSEKTVAFHRLQLGRFRDWLTHPLVSATAGEINAYLDYYRTAPFSARGTAADLYALLSQGETITPREAARRLYGDQAAQDDAMRCRVAMTDRGDLFRKIKHGHYSPLPNPKRHARRSEHSRNRVLGVMRVFFDWLVTRGAIAASPAAPIKWLGGDLPDDIEYAERPERDRILAAAEALGPDAGLSVWLGFYAGMRLGEIARLRVADVRLDAGWISLGRVKATTTKTRRARQVPIDPALAKRLKKSKRKTGRLLGWPEDYENTAEAVRKSLRQTLPDLAHLCGYNVFRHTFCSYLAQGGKFSIDQIAAISGHTPEVCRRHYAHLIPRDRSAISLDLS